VNGFSPETMNLKLAVIELDVGPAQNVRFGSKTDIRRKKGMSALSREVEIYSTVADVCYGQNQKFGRLLPNIGTMDPLDVRGSIKKINSRRGTLWRKLRK